MNQGKEYDVIVVGAGILGLVCTNMLVQETGLRVVNLSAGVSQQATLKNQNWLQSGAALLYDPVDDVPWLAVDSFVDTRRTMGLPVGKRRFDPESSILSIPVSKEDKLMNLAKYASEEFPNHFGRRDNRDNCEFAEKEENSVSLKARLGNYYNENGTYYNIHDDSFRLTLLVNQIINGIDELKGLENVLRLLTAKLTLSKVENQYCLSDGNGGIFQAPTVFLCTGGGTMSLLEELGLAEWEQEELKNQGFEILRSPVLALENRSELRSGLFINAMRDFAIMRHRSLKKGNLYQYATCHRDYHSGPEANFSKSDKKVDNLMKRIEKSGVHADGDFHGGLFCNRIERKISRPPAGCIAHTVEPFVSEFESCPGLVVGLPGKATFALNVAAQMMLEAGFDEPKDLFLGGYDTERLHMIHSVNEEPLRLSK